MDESPRVLMIPAAMVAYVTYRAGMRPPRGFWNDDKDGPLAGYTCFTLLNATTFYTSLLILVLLSSQRLHGTPARRAALGLIALFDMLCFACQRLHGTPARRAALGLIALFDMLCFASAFLVGASPGHPFLGFAILLAGALIGLLVYSGKLIRDYWAKRKIAGGNERV